MYKQHLSGPCVLTRGFSNSIPVRLTPDTSAPPPHALCPDACPPVFLQFASRTRQLCIRLLALVKWAGSVSKVDKSAVIMGFLDKQSMLFVDTADKLSQMARQELVRRWAADVGGGGDSGARV